MKIYVRNMACESCKVVVRDTLESMHVTPLKVDLGEVEIKEQLTVSQKKEFNLKVGKVGLELVEDKGGVLVEKIRKCILHYVKKASTQKNNFSDYLSAQLGYDYEYLSNLFSNIEVTTISNYMMAVKMEYAKEMIMFEDFSLGEIARKLNYSTLAHFSAQFKKTTGFTPSHFKKLKERRRMTIQHLNSSKKRNK